MFKSICLLGFLSLTSLAFATPLPSQPLGAEHPGSANYSYQLQHESFDFNRRHVDVFLPQNATQVPLIVFGHGQATPLEGYRETLEHLAKKGVAAAFIQYDSGFFDQDWERMAHDYMTLAAATLKRYPNAIDSKKVIFSGHSKGAYIAGMAAGLEPGAREIEPAAVVLFAPAGYDSRYAKRVAVNTPVTLIWGDQDTVIAESKVRELFNLLNVQKKQFIKAASYSGYDDEAKADHFFIMTHGFFFGGHDGVNPLHYYGAWKWLLGAAYDVNDGAHVTNPFLYGADTASTGVEGLAHGVERSF
jgi:dienelactone hydrolase